MNQQPRNRVRYKHPEKPSGTYKLSPAEIKNPQKVFSKFFKAYSLTDARILLREWQCELIQNNGSPADKRLSLPDHIERLVEAAWLLHKDNTREK